jgi:hypothetical protein
MSFIEEKNPNEKYQLPTINMADRDLTKKIQPIEEFEKDFEQLSKTMKWSEADKKQHHKFLLMHNYVLKLTVLDDLKKSTKKKNMSFSMTATYPEVENQIVLNYTRGCPYIERTQLPENKTITEEYIKNNITALTMHQFEKNIKKEKEYNSIIEKIIEKDKQHKLFDKSIKLKFLNFPNESYGELCSEGVATANLDKHNNLFHKLHWGQRKLILTEIQFLTKSISKIGKDQKIHLVYPGAAPGSHLMLLLDMFPNLVLYLWDPAYFDELLLNIDAYRRNPSDLDSLPMKNREQIIKHKGRVFINPELEGDDWKTFLKNTKEKTKEKHYHNELGFFIQRSMDWVNSNLREHRDQLLFVSDIRLFNNLDIMKYKWIPYKWTYNPCYRYTSSISSIEDYKRDMQLQKDWFNGIGAKYGLFKFKFPRELFVGDDVYYKYLKGEILFQPWAPVNTTETRLFVERTETTEKNDKGKAHTNTDVYYNIIGYNEKCAYFNTHIRPFSINDSKISDFGIRVQEDKKNTLTLKPVWQLILNQERIGMDALIETKILHDYLELYKGENNISLYDIIHVISDITKALKFKSFIEFRLPISRQGVPASDGISKRNHFPDFFQHRLDYASGKGERNICRGIWGF